MKPQTVLDIFRTTGALLEGHFIYTSGRHGRQFLQAARVLQYPEHTQTLCAAMAEHYEDDKIDVVVGPATGGIILAYETARHLGCRSVFSEKDGDGNFAVKRGFSLQPGQRALVVEDIITTGGSVKKTVAHLRERGVDVVGVCVLIDRSAGEAQFDCRFEALSNIHMESWDPEHCDLCSQNAPLVEPDDIVI
jgi:orotate phosphoribosyltransferase